MSKLVYFLSEKEKRLIRNLLSQGRENYTSEQWRGWAWHNTPLRPPYENVHLALSDIAFDLCETSRDIYLKYVEEKYPPPNKYMIRGGILHETIEKTIIEAKICLYSDQVRNGENFAQKMELKKEKILDKIFQSYKKDLNNSKYSLDKERELRKQTENLWNYEITQIASRIDKVCANHKYISIDSLVAKVMPFTVEQRLDGRFLGLSPHLSADAVSDVPIILDLKTGDFHPYQRLTTAGYSLVWEALKKVPIDVAVLINLSFDQSNSPIIKRKTHLIDDALRKQFIHMRDEKMKIVADNIDPGTSDHCYSICSYHKFCGG